MRRLKKTETKNSTTKDCSAKASKTAKDCSAKASKSTKATNKSSAKACGSKRCCK